MRKNVIFWLLLFPLLIYAEKISNLDRIINPRKIIVNNQSLYIQDQNILYIYDLKPFKFKLKFGKRGEGPGELVTTPRIEILEKSILLYAFNKYVQFDMNGELIIERKLPFAVIQMDIVGNIYVMSMLELKSGKGQTVVGIYDNHFNHIKTLGLFEESQPKKSEFPLFFPLFKFKCWQDEIYIADTTKGFHIDVFDMAGVKKRIITNDYVKIPIRDIDKKERIEWFTSFPSIKKIFRGRKINYLFPKYFPPIQDFSFSDQRLYIKTYKKVRGKEEYLIFDLMGNLKKKIMLSKAKQNLYCFQNSTFYYLKLDESGEIWELHKIEIE